MIRAFSLTMLGATLVLGGMAYLHLFPQVHAQDGHMQMSRAQAVGDSFDALMGRAMARMDHDMMVLPSGNYDRDFAAMMVPHHQGAVDMARIELQYGKDPVLRRLAQAIIVEQLQEIQVMNLQLEQLPAAASQRSPDQADRH
jgi:uncharacterized protein (DUF305 family)